MDRPGDDFFRYVNHDWLGASQIPPDQPLWNEWSRLAELNLERTRDILESCSRAPDDADQTKLGDLYRSLLDEAAIEDDGFRPVRADLERIEKIGDPAALACALAALSRDWLHNPLETMPLAPISAHVYYDYKDPVRYLPALMQGGLGVPDRDYLLSDLPNFERIRSAYRMHLADLFRAAGLSDVDVRADRVFALELVIARSHRPRVEMRDLVARYNLWTRDDLCARAPGLDWDAFLGGAGFPENATYLVADPAAITAVAYATHAESLQSWRDYLTSRVLMMFAHAGPASLVQERFHFEKRVLLGTPQPPPRWKRVCAVVDMAMGPALGRIYLSRFYPPSSRIFAEEIVRNIKAAMAERLRKLTWMNAHTKSRALAKLEVVTIETGGELQLPDYERLRIHSKTPYENLVSAARFEYDRRLAKLTGPIDRGEWQMHPQTVNAQANPILSKIMFPAGVMQEPFFDSAADAAANYGAFGMVAGHELSHIFDDLGAQFDERGALENWWTPEDHARFAEATTAMVEQYNDYEPLPGVRINGKLELGENIADLAGLTLAYDAYRHSLNGGPSPIIDGMSGEQRFFLSFARFWREKIREPQLRQQLATSGHAPGEWRVAQVRNLDAWYAAFNVEASDKAFLGPDLRVRIW